MPDERLKKVLQYYKDVSELLETYKQDVFNVYKAIQGNDIKKENEIWDIIADDREFIKNKMDDIELEINLSGCDKTNKNIKTFLGGK